MLPGFHPSGPFLPVYVGGRRVSSADGAASVRSEFARHLVGGHDDGPLLISAVSGLGASVDVTAMAERFEAKAIASGRRGYASIVQCRHGRRRATSGRRAHYRTIAGLAHFDRVRLVAPSVPPLGRSDEQPTAQRLRPGQTSSSQTSVRNRSVPERALSELVDQVAVGGDRYRPGGVSP